MHPHVRRRASDRLHTHSVKGLISRGPKGFLPSWWKGRQDQDCEDKWTWVGQRPMALPGLDLLTAGARCGSIVGGLGMWPGKARAWPLPSPPVSSGGRPPCLTSPCPAALGQVTVVARRPARGSTPASHELCELLVTLSEGLWRVRGSVNERQERESRQPLSISLRLQSRVTAGGL